MTYFLVVMLVLLTINMIGMIGMVLKDEWPAPRPPVTVAVAVVGMNIQIGLVIWVIYLLFNH